MHGLLLRIHGRVQGVGFRYHTRQEAERLGISGWVRNTSDGCVEVCISGPQPQLDAMQAWLNHGPSMARVDQIECQPTPAPMPAGFTIRGC
ncbi:MAG: acylphosphatase [Mariprofundus sp.]